MPHPFNPFPAGKGNSFFGLREGKRPHLPLVSPFPLTSWYLILTIPTFQLRSAPLAY
jgi:hypothetical protein